MNVTVDVYTMFYELRGMLSGPAQRNVDSLRDHAAGYVWAAEDFSGQHVRETYGREVNAAWEFPLMYGIYACLYELGQIFSRHPIREAYRSFVAGVNLGDYVS